MSRITSFIKTSPCSVLANSISSTALWWIVLELGCMWSKILASIWTHNVPIMEGFFLYIVFSGISIQTIFLITAYSFKWASQGSLDCKAWRYFSIPPLHNQLIWGLRHTWPAVCLSSVASLNFSQYPKFLYSFPCNWHSEFSNNIFPFIICVYFVSFITWIPFKKQIELCRSPKLLYKGFWIPTRSAQLYPLCPALFSFVLQLENPDSLFQCQCNRCLSPIPGAGMLLMQDKAGLRNDRGFQTLSICSQSARRCFKAEPINNNACYYLLFIDNVPYTTWKLLSKKKKKKWGLIFTRPKGWGVSECGEEDGGESHPGVPFWQLSIPQWAQHWKNAPFPWWERWWHVYHAAKK